MKNPLVSVITPTFNRADYLPIAVESVLAQSYGHFEHWIIDDGSTDETAEVMRAYLGDSRVRFLRQKHAGQSVARNRALSQSRGEFIAFLDSDDCWLPHKLERSLAAFDAQPDADVVYGDYRFIDAHGAELPVANMRRYSGRIVAQMLRDNCVSMNTTMARARCFRERGGFRGYRVADDYELWLRFAAYYRFLYIPEPLACYRLMGGQISSDKAARFSANESILRDFLAEHGDRVTAAEARAGWCHFHTRRGRYLARHGQRLQALVSYLRALRYSPAARPPWRALAKLALKGTG